MQRVGSACLELAVQVVHQGVHILAEGVVLLQADEVGNERVRHSSMLALPGCPVGQLGAHGGDGVEPCLQQRRVQLDSNAPTNSNDNFARLREEQKHAFSYAGLSSPAMHLPMALSTSELQSIGFAQTRPYVKTRTAGLWPCCSYTP